MLSFSKPRCSNETSLLNRNNYSTIERYHGWRMCEAVDSQYIYEYLFEPFSIVDCSSTLQSMIITDYLTEGKRDNTYHNGLFRLTGRMVNSCEVVGEI